MIRDDRKKNSRVIPYYFCTSSKHAATYLLQYASTGDARATIKRDFIKVTPSGFMLRRYEFSTVEKLVHWFKKNVDTAPKEKEAPRRPPPAPQQPQPAYSGYQQARPAQPNPTGGYSGG